MKPEHLLTIRNMLDQLEVEVDESFSGQEIKYGGTVNIIKSELKRAIGFIDGLLAGQQKDE